MKHATFVILYRNLSDDGANAAFPSPHKVTQLLIYEDKNHDDCDDENYEELEV